MFPTFISILDIQSWWEVPSIAHFCSLFRTAFNLLDFDIEDLEEALLTDGTEESSWLQELIVRLLSGCLPNNEISTFNYQMFLRRLFRQKCQEYDLYNPFNTDIDFQLLPLRTKVDILHALCDFRLDAEDVLEQLKNLEADSLRVEPLGTDDNKSAYWYFYGTRLYREDFKNKSKKGKSVWQVICFTEDDWFQLAKKFKESTSKAEKQLYQTLNENFLPELPRLFREKERLARKRLLENQPRRTSSRLRKQEVPFVEEEPKQKDKEDVERQRRQEEEEEKLRKKQELQNRRREAYERRARLRDQSEDSQSDRSDGRYEMAGTKSRDKKNKSRQRKVSESSAGSKDITTRSSVNRNNGKTTAATGDGNKTGVSSTTVGRQTNNSLASATGQIVIQPIANPHRKKLKTSQVFRQTDEDLQTGMYKILEHVKNHEDAWPFIDPVDEEYAPNYYSIIRKPMDLQRMEDRLDSGHYKNYSKFKGDFQLIVDNCRLYNGADNEYTEMVDNLLQVFERATERFLDQISSSDEEIAVEYPEADGDGKLSTKRRKTQISSTNITTTKRKPTLVAQTDKIKDSSLSDESARQSTLSPEVDKNKFNKKEVPKNKKQSKNVKIEKITKKIDKKDLKKKNQKNVKNKKKRSPSKSPIRSRSQSVNKSQSPDRWSSSPPPSWPPSSPEPDNDLCSTKKKSDNKKSTYQVEDEGPDKSIKKKHKQNIDKWDDIFKNDNNCDKPFKSNVHLIPKQKDKHNKLRETIEKLKAKSEISNTYKDKEIGDMESEKTKENIDLKKRNKTKSNLKTKDNKDKSYDEYEDGNSTLDSSINSRSKTNSNKNSYDKNASLDALTLATEQTLKDINKWLDDTSPKFRETSSTSNSPSHYSVLDDYEKTDPDNKKKTEKTTPKRDNVSKDIKKRNVHRDPTKFFKKREVQRTIDRLQPGKSKGNLLSNVQTSNKSDDIFPLGPLSKIKDSKNSLIVKPDDNAPKLSLGSVLDSFGKHKFVDDQKKDDENSEIKTEIKQEESLSSSKSDGKDTSDISQKDDNSNTKTDNVAIEEKKSCSPGKATPNLSAWFKAFGVSKVQPLQKKTEVKASVTEIRSEAEKENKEEPRKVPPPETSPNSDSPQLHGPTMPRQRKISTGSSVSERSSFSQDMDSPRVGIEERLGAYPAPYPSPLHKSPSGASPIMASPRPDVSPKAASYPSFNGQIRVGFYQDTVSTKSSPEKSCSPRDNPQSPYPQYSEHVYTPQSTQPYSYNNTSYYPQTPNYSSTNPTPPYNNSENYYDTNKPLTDQYQAKSNTTMLEGNYHQAQTQQIQQQPQQQQTQQQQPEPVKMQEKLQTSSTAMFPVKKRVYSSDIDRHRYESEQQELQQQYNRTMEQLQVNENIPQNQAQPMQMSPVNTRDQQKYNNTQDTRLMNNQPQEMDNNEIRNLNYTASNAYNYNNYALNVPNARPLEQEKFVNTGYPTSDMQYNVDNNPPQYNRQEVNYSRTITQTSNTETQSNPMPMRYNDSNLINMGYKGVNVNAQHSPHMTHMNTNTNIQQQQPRESPAENVNRLDYKPPEMSIPRPPYSTSSSSIDMSNLSNLTHIVDRYPSDERILPPAPYYTDKNLMFSKPMSTSTSGIPMFSQPNAAMTYSHDMQPTSTSMYNRQMEMQNTNLMNQEKNVNVQQQPVTEKKTKRRKSSKTSTPPISSIEASGSSSSAVSASNQGFQTYVGLKSTAPMEPSAISLKTASVVPGSAFNFGPTATGLGLSTGLYGDKDPYPNFLDDLRSAPNYYMAAAAAAHHRSTPDNNEKQTRPTHQQPTSQPSSYPFIGAPQPRPPSYPLGGHFMPPHQAPLMDTSSPIYRQYLQAGMLPQGLLGPPGTYPPGYHPALSIRQQYDTMTRPPWL